MPTNIAQLRHRAALWAIAAPIATIFAVFLLCLDALEADAAPAHDRAWELVTGSDSNGAPGVTTFAIDATGDRIAYLTIGPTSGAVAGTFASANLATRGAGGWSRRPVGHPYLVPVADLRIPMPVGASKDLSSWIWSSPLPLLPGAPSTPDSGVYRGTLDGGLTLLGHGGNTDAILNVVGMSEDAEHVVFQTPSQLLAADSGRASGEELYEYDGTTLKMVAVDGAGTPLSTCGSIGGSASKAANPVSRDGRRIFFTSPGTTCASGPQRVYMREDGNTTIEISASQCEHVDCNGPADVYFMGATPDGGSAFLATTQHLTGDDGNTTMDLYRYDVATGWLTRVSIGSVDQAADVVPTRAYFSDDGKRVFFLAKGELVPGQGTVGEPNLYVTDDQDGLRFVATLQGVDPDPMVFATPDDWPAGNVTNSALQEVAVTPSGKWLMFVTGRALLPDDSDEARDVYLYEANDEELMLVSGTDFTGEGNVDVEASLSDDFFIFPPFPIDIPSALSDDGRHVFFTTAESLLPGDVNTAVDVYEWSDGEIGLVSSGTGAQGAFYLGASPDSSTAFISTDQGLIPADDDNGDYDIYAARVGGGFPDPPAPPADCSGEACLPPPLGRVSRQDPESLTQAGPVDSPKPRLRVRRAGRSALRRAARTGRLTLVVHAPRAGRISAVARARIDRRRRTVASGGATATRAGRIALRLRLSKVARDRLADGNGLSVRVVLHHSRIDRASVVRLELKGVK